MTGKARFGRHPLAPARMERPHGLLVVSSCRSGRRRARVTIAATASARTVQDDQNRRTSTATGQTSRGTTATTRRPGVPPAAFSVCAEAGMASARLTAATKSARVQDCAREEDEPGHDRQQDRRVRREAPRAIEAHSR